MFVSQAGNHPFNQEFIDRFRVAMSEFIAPSLNESKKLGHMTVAEVREISPIICREENAVEPV